VYDADRNSGTGRHWWAGSRIPAAGYIDDRHVELSCLRSSALEGVLNEDLQKSDHIDACRTGRPVGGAGLVIKPVWLRSYSDRFQEALLGCPDKSVFLPHRLVGRMPIIAFAGVDLVALLLGDDLDFPEFSIPVLVLRVVAEAVLVMQLV
jgi:hypothetical protein